MKFTAEKYPKNEQKCSKYCSFVCLEFQNSFPQLFYLSCIFLFFFKLPFFIIPECSLNALVIPVIYFNPASSPISPTHPLPFIFFFSILIEKFSQTTLKRWQFYCKTGSSGWSPNLFHTFTQWKLTLKTLNVKVHIWFFFPQFIKVCWKNFHMTS